MDYSHPAIIDHYALLVIIDILSLFGGATRGRGFMQHTGGINRLAFSPSLLLNVKCYSCILFITHYSLFTGVLI